MFASPRVIPEYDNSPDAQQIRAIIRTLRHDFDTAANRQWWAGQAQRCRARSAAA